MRSFWGTIFMNDISDRVLDKLSKNIHIFLEGKPFLESISSWFDKILDKAVLYKKNKQEDKYVKLLETINNVTYKLNEAINEDNILREYETTVQFNIFETKNKDTDPLILKLFFNVTTKASYNPKTSGINLFTYINDRDLSN